VKGGSVKAGAVGLGILGLLILVAMAARGGHPSLGGHVASRPVPDSVQDDFVTLLALVYIIGIVAFVFIFFRYHGQWKEPQSRWLLNYALLIVLMLVVTAVGYVAITHGRPQQHNQRGTAQQAQRGGGGAGAAAQARRIPVRHAHFQWPLAAGVGGLLLLGAALAFLRGRPGRPRDRATTLEEALADAVETSIDDLRNERDPRRAVVAAYAQMERALTAHGLGRDPAEAPLEYLARVLRGLRVRESAVVTLTRLFEYAKFSAHEIDAAMKQDAIDALAAIGDDLRGEQELAA
jgi:Domain of unknown function (DUF4129)